MTTYSDLWAAAPDKEALRKQLGLSYVCAQLGLQLDRNGAARCPFHDDRLPSFRLWTGDDGVERWHCFPCRAGGDLYDLIQRVRGCDFSTALDYAVELRATLPEGYQPPLHLRDPRGPEDWADKVTQARERARTMPGLMASLAGFAPAEDEQLCATWDAYLRDTWGWGVTESGTILIPHWNEAGELTGCKLRLGATKKSLPGSRYEDLYGAFLGRQYGDVLLLEGERDTVYAYAQSAGVDTYGIPGAGFRITEDALGFIGRRSNVFLGLDNDDAGAAATEAWLEAIPTAKVLPIPPGHDICSCGLRVTDLIAQASR